MSNKWYTIRASRLKNGTCIITFKKRFLKILLTGNKIATWTFIAKFLEELNKYGSFVLNDSQRCDIVKYSLNDTSEYDIINLHNIHSWFFTDMPILECDLEEVYKSLVELYEKKK